VKNNILVFWIENARWVALPQSGVPALLSVCLALSSPNFSFLFAALAFFGVLFGHLGINLWDDYFDYKKGDKSIRNRLNSNGIRARIDKCHYITSGDATVKELGWVATIFCTIALAIGGIIFLERGLPILILALITAFFGISYSGPPFRFSYHGLGELVIGAVFGPLLMTGVYIAACGAFSLQIVFISIPIGLLVSNIVYTHSVIDYEADKAINKKTLAVILQKKIRMNIVSFLLIFSPFIIIAVAVFSSILPMGYLFTFLTLFHAFYLYKLIINFQNNKLINVQPKRWMGPMEKWEPIQEAGIQWFMIRWYLARNLLIFFSLLIITIIITLTFVT